MRKMMMAAILVVIVMAGVSYGMTLRADLSGAAVWNDGGTQKIMPHKVFQIDLYATNNDTIPYVGAKRTYWVTPFEFSGDVEVQWGDTGTIIMPQFRAFWDDLASSYYENWDGNLPDLYSFAGSSSFSGTGYPAGLGEIKTFSWSLQVLSNSGSICIASGDAIDEAYDWLFEAPVPSFDMVCWTVAPDPNDIDSDGIPNISDNCPSIYNPTQSDQDSDGIGDTCDICRNDASNDIDSDGICGLVDNCPSIANADQADVDHDGRGDLCDNCPSIYNPYQEDADGDNIADVCDNCPTTYNPGQEDSDNDGIGNACDPGLVAFGATPQCGASPLSVTFTDLSTPVTIITSWRWDFGDGESSTLQNPIHQYMAAGIFDVTLTISDGIHYDTLVRESFITTQNGIETDFIGIPTTGVSPLAVMFEPVVSGVVNEYLWDFGDGSTSDLKNPIHSYLSQGIYDVKLKVRLELDGCSQVDSTTKSEYVTVRDLKAEFFANPQVGQKPLAVQFTDISAGSPTSWEWDFGDGGTSSDKNPLHYYNTAGTYNVKLKVANAYFTDSLLRLDYITVKDIAPADIGADIWVGGARPGFDFWFYVLLYNHGGQSANDCVMKILPPNPMTFYDAYVFQFYPYRNLFYTLSNDTIVIPLWDIEPSYNDTGNYYSGEVIVYGNLPGFPTVKVGDTLVCKAWITTSSTDSDLKNNTVVHPFIVTGSIDPNDKKAYPDGTGAKKEIYPDQRIDYTIQFENKKEASEPATYIFIVDTLDPNLDWGSLTMGKMSHPDACTYEFDPYTGVIVWTCNNIMLPPNVNPPEGEGYVTYSVSPKLGLVEGNEIKNEAHIRFDYNEWLLAPEGGPVLRTIKNPFICGDINNDKRLNLSDISFTIAYLYYHGAPPVFRDAGDVNHDGKINLLDISYLINFLYRHGAPPSCP